MSPESRLPTHHIESRIFTIRGIQVMLDSDLAEMYAVSTGRLNEQVKRNKDRFPDDFMFRLNEEEWQELQSQKADSSTTSVLRSQNAILDNGRGKHRKYLPFVFTEQGVAGLSGIIKSDVASRMHEAIMRAFVAMRKLIQDHQLLYHRLSGIERKQLETDQKFEQIFRALERKDIIPNQGVFLDGQVFDAYELTSKIIRSATQNITLIDNYVDETTLAHLAKKKKNVRVLLLTKKIGQQLTADLSKANQQYGDFSALPFDKSHDRFLIIDEKEVYHLGASLKDLGKKWFAFSKMDQASVVSILDAVTTVQKLQSR